MTKLVRGLLTAIVLFTISCQPKVAETTQPAAVQESVTALPVSDKAVASVDSFSPADLDTLANAKADEYWKNQQEPTVIPAKTEYKFMGYMHKEHASMLLLSVYLTEENGKLTGKYFYHRTARKEDLRLEGTKQGDAIELTEYGSDSHMTGRFEGTLDSEGDFFGQWISPDEKKKRSFKMRSDKVDYQERKKRGLKPKELEKGC